VSDHGMGIPSEDVSHLFTRFFRAKNAISNQIPGTGLGLAIVQKIVQVHGGVIHAQSELGKGTTMEMRFPEAISKVEGMVAARRIPVLDRAILRIKSAVPSDIPAAAHEIGGAIGFYTFIQEGERILEISRLLEGELALRPEIAEGHRVEILSILNTAKSKLEAEEQ